MQTFLAIIGGFALAIVGLVLLALFLLRRRLRKVMSQFEGMAQVAGPSGQIIPPMRIRLRPDNGYAWHDEEHVQAVGDDLAARGFVRIGTFSSEPPTAPIEAWHDPQQSIYAAICEHPTSGIWLDVLSLGQDGSSFTVTSGPGDQLARPTDFQLERMPGAATADVVSHFLENRPDVPVQQTSAESFPAAFESLWERMMDFRLEQGAPTEEEIRRLCVAEGGDDPQVETVGEIREMWQSQINDELERKIRESFLQSSSYSALEWDRMRDRVVFIHDDLSAEDLASLLEIAWEHNVDDDLDNSYEALEERAAELLSESPGRQAFEAMNNDQESAMRFEKIGAVTQPVAADVYLGQVDMT